MKKTAVLDLLNGKIWKTLLAFALPFMLSSLMQSLYSTVDTIVVGQYVGSVGLSAVSVGGNLIQLAAQICTGLSMAGQILIAQHIGAGQQKQIKTTIATMFWSLVACSALISVIYIVLRKQLLGLLSTPAESFAMAEQYIIICGSGILFTGLYNMMSAVFRAMGDSRHPFIFICIASLVNLVLDVVFVCVFHWAAAGAALATVIGQAVSVLYSLVFLVRHRTEYNMDFQKGEFRVSASALRLMAKLGIPMMLQGSAVNISFLFVSKFVNQLGVSVSAAYGVGQKLWQIPLILGGAVGQASSAMLGQNLGAHQYDRVRSIVHWALIYNAVIYGVICGLCLIFPEYSFRIFTQDESILVYAATWAAAMAVGAIAHILMGGFNGLINAVGDTHISMIFGIADAFLGRVLLSYLLGIVLQLGATGFFFGYTSAAFLTAIPGFCYYKFVNWENRGLHKRSAGNA